MCTINENHTSPTYSFANTRQNRTDTGNPPANSRTLTSYLHPHLYLTYNNGRNTLRCDYWPIQSVSGTDLLAGIFIF
jgi:hypothetical protein